MQKEKQKIKLKGRQKLKTKLTSSFFLMFLCKLTNVRSLSSRWLSPNIPPWDDISIDPAIVISNMLKIIRYFMFCYWVYKVNSKFYVNELFFVRQSYSCYEKIFQFIEIILKTVSLS